MTDGYFLSLMPCQGGFVEGYASGYNGTGIVSRSVGLNAPIIYVSFNYRLNGTSFSGKIVHISHDTVFGFLGGKEVQQLVSATSGCTIVSIYSPGKM